ncbi:MAG: hypothetical protein HYU64_00170 [Armatimonadetes bacterium]|nr:hypothetical protein [Armatimonadota bacterium]
MRKNRMKGQAAWRVLGLLLIAALIVGLASHDSYAGKSNKGGEVIVDHATTSTSTSTATMNISSGANYTGTVSSDNMGSASYFRKHYHSALSAAEVESYYLSGITTLPANQELAAQSGTIDGWMNWNLSGLTDAQLLEPSTVWLQIYGGRSVHNYGGGSYTSSTATYSTSSGTHTEVTANSWTQTQNAGTGRITIRRTNTNTDTKTITANLQYTQYSLTASGHTSPLVLDLDGDGKLQASGGSWLTHPNTDLRRVVVFDIDGNGFESLVEWVGPQDGLLVQPRADGTMDGTCLFGTADGYDDGYQKLVTLDLNRDGKITGKELEGLQVWQDKNTNGTLESGELLTLESLGITELGCRHRDYVSYFVQKGKKQTMWDWWPNMGNLRTVEIGEVR